MSEFKVGASVRVKPDAREFGRVDSRVSPGETGVIVGVLDNADYKYRVKGADDSEEYFRPSQLILTEKTWGTLEVGDILLQSDGKPRRIFGAMGEVVVLGHDETIDGGTSRWNDIYTLQRDGWTIKQDSPVADTTELSVAELEEKLGIASGTLRVKED